ncbi:hypothetical protein ASZ90_006849 [hydrocarbon metagenome]|uniref:Carboxypeptidase regulatory-like domain-containing protein n=1 Tax=hydrocarbon metagenome TaxID=938273 RepID=A0A0W8FQY5_9ZZZZ
MTKMNKIILLSLIVLTVCLCFSSSAYAWLYYSKPDFRGRVIDAQTRQPIKDAVVVVLYYKYEFGWPGGGSSVPMNAKETLTDNKGEFYFPSYKTMISPLSGGSYADFIIFKPGYKAIDNLNGLPINIACEKYFAIKQDMIGKEGEIKYVERDTVYSYKGPLGIVKLERALTRKERLDTMPSPPTNYTSKELPMLIKILNEEDKNLGLKGEYK